MGGIVNAVADVVGLGPASKQSKATTQAADTSAAAARYAADLQKQMFDKQLELQAPFRASGLAAQNQLNQLLGIGANTGNGLYGKYARDFSMKDFTTDPGYAFRMKEGLTALDRQAAARGGLISGGALKAAERYGQDLGSQEYMNAFNRYQTNRANQLNPLQSITGAGQTATNQLAGAAGAYGANAGNIAMTGGANQANAYLTKGNIAASQYGTYGKALDEALNTDWSSVGNKIKGFFQ
jgi:hypothetical protein